MSADSIGTCPDCEWVALREWFELTPEKGENLILVVEYRAKCYECGFAAVAASTIPLHRSASEEPS